MPDFSIPLSGLTAESTDLSAIANNLANQNTTGYKDTQVQFSDLFYQQLGTTGSGDPIQVGAGTEIELTIPSTVAFEKQRHSSPPIWRRWLNRDKQQTGPESKLKR